MFSYIGKLQCKLKVQDLIRLLRLARGVWIQVWYFWVENMFPENSS